MTSSIVDGRGPRWRGLATAKPGLPQAGSVSADITIEAYEAGGFDVQVQYLTGTPEVPLSECSVNAIHNPSSATPSPSTMPEVYLYVACPGARK